MIIIHGLTNFTALDETYIDNSFYRKTERTILF